MESTTNNDSSTSICRLSDLPEHLLFHIFSFLSTFDAIKASPVCRKWRNLWCSIPSLYFSYDLFPPSDSPSATRRRFADSVDHTLLHRHPNSPLHSFRLEFLYKESEYYSVIDSWILYAINRHVVNLEIDFYIRPGLHDEQDEYFDFPFYTLRNSCVRDLEIVRCYLSLPTHISSGEFASIQTLFLDQIELTDQMVSDLMIGCPNIESLTIESCYGMKDIKIKGLKITKLALRCYHGGEGSVEIDCPNLQVLDIAGYEEGKYTLKDSSALVEAYLWFIHQLQYYDFWCKAVRIVDHVRKLRVQNWWYKLLLPNDVSSGSLKFHQLRWLELQTGYTHFELLGMAALLELAPNLDTLVLDYLYKLEEEEESIPEDLSNKPISLSLPRLRQVKMKAFGGTENEVLVLNLLKLQGVVLQKIVVVPMGVDDISYPPVVLAIGAKVQEPSPTS